MHVAHKVSSLKVVTKPSWGGTDHIHSSVEGILLQGTAKKYITIIAVAITGMSMSEPDTMGGLRETARFVGNVRKRGWGGGQITYTVICATSYCPFQ